jgi:ubiquinone/menaquinone biosynthesis C-methylase UbiE
MVCLTFPNQNTVKQSIKLADSNFLLVSALSEDSWVKEKVEEYARNMKKTSKWVYAPFAKEVAENLGSLRKGSVILDLSTGPGFLSIELNKLLPEAKIIGVDPSKDMLEVAEKNVEEAGMTDYEARLGRAEEIPLKSNSVDLVVNQSSLHDWKNHQQAFREIFRILKPNGRLMLKDSNRVCSKWKLRLFSLVILFTCGRKSAKDHLSSYEAAFSFGEAEDMLKKAGFSEIGGKDTGLEFFIQATKQG